MTPARINLQTRQGDTFTHPLTGFADDGVTMDLTGYDIAAQIRRQAADSTAIDFTIDESDAANGNLILSLTAEQTAAMDAAVYVWDFEWTDPGGATTTLFEGSFRVTEQVTR